jgi:hypothetical protein
LPHEHFPFTNKLSNYSTGASCYRELPLLDCYDQARCLVKNGWHSLEPHCAGNAHYAHVEYDCQPAYHMCDAAATVVSGVLSGLVYSPHYPASFRQPPAAADAAQPCFLTIHLPRRHHLQLTLDFFDTLQTKSCVGDYLEVQQYVETSASLKRSSATTYEFGASDG